MAMEAENVVIGSGPAGLAAAAFARGGALVLEARKEPGWKILASGGGHCNVTNTLAPAEFLRRLASGARFLKAALHGFPPEAIRTFLAEHDCPTVVRDGWHVYPKSNRAADVLAALVDAAAGNGSEVFTAARVGAISKTAQGFAIEVKGDTVRCRRLLVASGSPASDRPRPEFDRILERLGHAVRPWVASLAPVPLGDNPFEGLAGVSFEGRVAVAGKWREPGDVLVTDEGLSGEAVMNASGAINRAISDGGSGAFALDLLPGQSRMETEALFERLRSEHPRALAERALEPVLPNRLAARVAALAGLSGEGSQPVVISQLRRDQRDRAVALVHEMALEAARALPPARGYAASGGIPLEEVNPRTMESRIVQGLYFAGEMLDYDAPSGGFNITLALATGRLAAASWPEASE